MTNLLTKKKNKTNDNNYNNDEKIILNIIQYYCILLSTMDGMFKSIFTCFNTNMLKIVLGFNIIIE